MIWKQIELKDEGTQIFQTRAKLELLGQALKAFHSCLKSLLQANVSCNFATRLVNPMYSKV